VATNFVWESQTTGLVFPGDERVLGLRTSSHWLQAEPCLASSEQFTEELVSDEVRGISRPFVEQVFGFGKVRVEFEHARELLACPGLLAFLPQNF
jgi:hypothetical protein